MGGGGGSQGREGHPSRDTKLKLQRIKTSVTGKKKLRPR